jgi:hypothetical protein
VFSFSAQRPEIRASRDPSSERVSAISDDIWVSEGHGLPIRTTWRDLLIGASPLRLAGDRTNISARYDSHGRIHLTPFTEPDCATDSSIVLSVRTATMAIETLQRALAQAHAHEQRRDRPRTAVPATVMTIVPGDVAHIDGTTASCSSTSTAPRSAAT